MSREITIYSSPLYRDERLSSRGHAGWELVSVEWVVVLVDGRLEMSHHFRWPANRGWSIFCPSGAVHDAEPRTSSASASCLPAFLRWPSSSNVIPFPLSHFVEKLPSGLISWLWLTMGIGLSAASTVLSRLRRKIVRQCMVWMKGATWNQLIFVRIVYGIDRLESIKRFRDKNGFLPKNK